MTVHSIECLPYTFDIDGYNAAVEAINDINDTETEPTSAEPAPTTALTKYLHCTSISSFVSISDIVPFYRQCAERPVPVRVNRAALLKLEHLKDTQAPTALRR
jgi:hypothetical protein